MQSYESTRDRNDKLSSSNAILNGIAKDGGLYVMRDLEEKSIDINSLMDKSYKEMAEIILGVMLDDFSTNEIKNCVEKSYTDKFSKDEMTPVVKVGEDYITELFYGPTSAFKDVALSILPHLITTSFIKNDIKKEVIILTATSGDTGKAALEGFKDVESTKIIVFYPEGGVSQIQKSQMETQDGNNTYVCAIKGNFDDAQTGVKNIFANKELNDTLNEKNKMFSSANSINIGRLVPQVVYYFYSYIDLVKKGAIKLHAKVNFSVPTGNFGNILAGYYAKILGLPINKLICASNENNVLYDFIKTGIYDKNRDFHKTISPSMDILISSNLERLLYYISEKDNDMVKSLMKQLNENGKYSINQEMKDRIKAQFCGGCVCKKDTEETIKQTYDDYGYLLDTHTAVAYKTLQDYKNRTGDKTISIVLSTASPFKFSKSVYEALFGRTDIDEFSIMYDLCHKTGTEIPMNLKSLQSKKVLHCTVCDKNEMEEYIKTIGEQND